MDLGFLDKNGRAYAADFTATGKRVLDPGGELLPPEEVVVHRGEATCGVYRKKTFGRSPVLADSLAEVIRTEARLLVLVIPTRERDPGAPSRFFQEVEGVPLSAVRHLLMEEGGREYLEVPSEEVRGGRVHAGAAEVVVSSGAMRNKPKSGDTVLRFVPEGDAHDWLAHILP